MAAHVAERKAELEVSMLVRDPQVCSSINDNHRNGWVISLLPPFLKFFFLEYFIIMTWCSLGWTLSSPFFEILYLHILSFQPFPIAILCSVFKSSFMFFLGLASISQNTSYLEMLLQQLMPKLLCLVQTFAFMLYPSRYVFSVTLFSNNILHALFCRSLF